ncbi:MAG: Septum formation protein Maf [uncultured Sphingomonadaceae bacterium]|uniref:Nucleoside triphosphate pyrophosphatase n=1 Tax=uncultured Sphingomonadaceae bacterium TaxID=169976 RepID=A0A6J4TVL5_9SPHN|nr:MAG: Septum formation protein Maf [uncultured Sphingomonadaceae bacterium]
MRLVLASTSASRAAMLRAAGVAFEAVAPGVDERGVEDALHDIAPATLAATLAQKKALAVRTGAGALVLGSDSVLETEDGRSLSKSASRDDARAQLRALRGRPHRLISAAAIVEDGDVVWRGTEIATMHVRDFSDAFLDDYLDREWEQIRHCVGGYRMEALGVQLFDRVEGSHFAILGLPLLPVLGYLRERGVVAT